jgi:hypothetical protein
MSAARPSKGSLARRRRVADSDDSLTPPPGDYETTTLKLSPLSSPSTTKERNDADLGLNSENSLSQPPSPSYEAGPRASRIRNGREPSPSEDFLPSDDVEDSGRPQKKRRLNKKSEGAGNKDKGKVKRANKKPETSESNIKARNEGTMVQSRNKETLDSEFVDIQTLAVQGSTLSPQLGISVSMDRSNSTQEISRTPQPNKRSKLPPIPKKNRKAEQASRDGTLAKTSSGTCVADGKRKAFVSAPTVPKEAISKEASTSSQPAPTSSNNARHLTNDFDLRDASTYRNLFGMSKSSSNAKTGASTPRPTVNVSTHK